MWPFPHVVWQPTRLRCRYDIGVTVRKKDCHTRFQRTASRSFGKRQKLTTEGKVSPGVPAVAGTPLRDDSRVSPCPKGPSASHRQATAGLISPVRQRTV